MKLINWISRSFQEESGKVSGKRLTLSAFVLMLFYVVGRYTDHSNAVSMAGALIGGALALAGVSAYQSIKNNKDAID